MSILFLGCAPKGLEANLSAGENTSTEDRMVNDEANVVEEISQAYTFSEGDIIGIKVFREPDLSSEYKVDADGFLSFPMIGKVKVAGLDADDVAKLLRDELKKGYLKKPDIMVSAVSYRPFSILGEVSSPGNYEFVEGFTVADAVAKAGGFTYRSNQKEVELLRRAENGWVKADANIGEIVKPGDIIYVRERLF